MVKNITYTGKPFKTYYKTYDGGTFVLWHDVYDVIEVKGDRVVIGVDGVVTCAININNIAKV